MADCPMCETGIMVRAMEESGTANRTGSRWVGGRNVEVRRECNNCGHTEKGTHGSTGEWH